MLKNPLNPVKMTLLGVWLFLLIIGCQSTTNEGKETPVGTETSPHGQASTLTNVTTIVSTRPTFESVAPTETLALSPTISPTPEATSTPLPTETTTPTPWSTLSPGEAANKVLSLLQDNQNPGCLLPCWWGATPGQTYWQDIELFLNSFAIKTRVTPRGASVTLPLPESVAVPGFDYNVVYVWDESGVIHEIDIDPINMPGYDAKTMVTLYGIPDEVWLKTRSAPREGVLPFQLILVYQERGISFHYYADATRTENNVVACFGPGIELERPDLFPAAPRIYLWEPGQSKTIHEISPIPLEQYFRLQIKTDLTPETLYEKFINPDEEPCIITPSNLW